MFALGLVQSEHPKTDEGEEMPVQACSSEANSLEALAGPGVWGNGAEASSYSSLAQTRHLRGTSCARDQP